MRYAGGELSVEPTQMVAAIPAIVAPILKGANAFYRGKMIERATTPAGQTPTLDDAVDMGYPGMEREGAIMMRRREEPPAGAGYAL